MSTCPKDCEEDRRRSRQDIVVNSVEIKRLWEYTVAPWLRNIIIFGLAASFLAQSSYWVYAASIFQTKESAINQRMNMLDRFKSIDSKLDILLNLLERK